MNLIRAAAEVWAGLAEKARQLVEWNDDLPDEFAGVDIVGIDFSTSVQRIASHIIHGWDRYRLQVQTLKRDHGVWAFGVNSVPFPLTRRPVSPEQLPSFLEKQFLRRGDGPGLVEFGSAFYDYFLMALGHAHNLATMSHDRPTPLAITISLLCDGLPNGGVYRADDVRPLLTEARAQGVRFKLVGLTLARYRPAMNQFRNSLGLTREELEVAWYDDGIPDGQTVDSSFEFLSYF